MHELPIMENVLRVVLAHARKNMASKIITIHLKVGELSHLEEEWMQHYFNYLSKNTIACEADLKIEKVPVSFQCADCNQTFQVDIKKVQDIKCPYCGGSNNTLISGKEYFISHMEAI